MQFAHQTLAQRVRFATGAATIGVAEEVALLAGERVLLLAAESEAELAMRIAERLPGVRLHDEVAMHVPVPVAERARAVAEEHRADVLVSVGGGSTTGLAKAVALTTGLPIVAVPTTYAGSEATPVWGLTEEGKKTTGTDLRVLPRVVVYDADLTLSLPIELSIASGINAMAHCIDSMWAPASDPIDRALAGEGIRTLATGLVTIKQDPQDREGREQTLYGAYLSAVAFASAGSGLHHKICHVLGGRYDLPHAQTHAVVLPHVLAFNAPNSHEAEDRIADALDTGFSIDGLIDLCDELEAPRALRDLGMTREQIAPAVEEVLAGLPEGNPTEVTHDNLTTLLTDAWEGRDPR